MSGVETTATCPCGQALVVSLANLNAFVMCPRCGVTRPASSLVQAHEPVRALPVTAGGTVVMAAIPAPAPPVFLAAPSPMPEAPPAFDDRPAFIAEAPRLSPAANPLPAQPLAESPYGAPPVQRRGPPTWSILTAIAVTLGNAAWAIDAKMAGRRLVWVGTGGVAVLVVRHLAPEWYPWAVFFYSSFLYALLLARVWWIRDDRGEWSWGRFISRVSASAGDAIAIFSSSEFSWNHFRKQLCLGSASIGIILLALAPPAAATARSAAEALGIAEQDNRALDFIVWLEGVGGSLLFLAAFLWLLGHFQKRSPATEAFTAAAASLRAHASGLPLAIDARKPDAAAGVPPNLQPLITTLAQWRPRRQTRESGYEQSLVRFLDKQLRGVKTRTQEHIRASDGSRSKIDVIVDDTLALELKRSLTSSSEADRAVGQVAKYAEVWTKGPVILLLCEAAADFEQQGFVRRIGDLRYRGRSVFVVAAGARA